MNFRLFFSLFLLLLSTFSHASEIKTSGEPTVFDIIMQRIQLSEWSAAPTVYSIDADTKTYAGNLLTNGSWADIDYSSTASSDWEPINHLVRLKTLVLAYTLKTSAYYGSDVLYQKILSAFNYWYTKDPRSTNWYKQEISSPLYVGVLLILMRSGVTQLPQTLEKDLLNRMASIGGSPDEPYRGIGANKVEIATHWIYRGCLTKNDSILSFGVQQVYYPMYMTTDEGLQHDFSYFFNGQQFYTGGYGVPFIKNIAKIANFTKETPYEIGQEKKDLLVRFTRDHYFKLIRGKYFLYNAIGRDLSRPSLLNATVSLDMAAKVKSLDPDNAAVYDAAIKRLKTEEPANYQVSPEHIHYWRGDYSIYNSTDYTFDVRMASTRTCRSEYGNGENLKGYFLTDGANAIAVDGNEYLDIFPVWEWTKIPGVTAPQKTTIPLPPEWGNRGTSLFAGGVSNGTYGVTTYLLNDQQYSVNTTARKSWFAFGNEIVCLGSGIKSTAAEQINTTINQCLLNGDVIIKSNNSESLLNAGKYNYNSNVSWIYHNKVGYFFPKGGNINLTNKQESGSWSSINKAGSTTIINKNVFKLWFNHGTAPTAANYAYIIVPGKEINQIRSYDASDIEIIINSDSLQVIHHKKLNIWGMVFYRAASFRNSLFSLKADKACALMLKDPDLTTVKGWLSDPSQSQSAINLRFSSSAIPSEKELKAVLPAVPYAGSTIEFIISRNSSSIIDKTQPGISTGMEYSFPVPDKLFVSNPIKIGETARLVYQSEQTDNILLKLFDINGKDIISEHYPVYQGENVIPVETASISRGMYVVSIFSQFHTTPATKKILIN